MSHAWSLIGCVGRGSIFFSSMLSLLSQYWIISFKIYKCVCVCVCLIRRKCCVLTFKFLFFCYMFLCCNDEGGFPLFINYLVFFFLSIVCVCVRFVCLWFFNLDRLSFFIDYRIYIKRAGILYLKFSTPFVFPFIWKPCMQFNPL